MILGRLWMKKHGVLLDMINNSILFSSGYCSYFGAPLVSVPNMPKNETKIISMAIQQDILPYQILKKGSAEKIYDFLKIPEEISDKKRQLINASKQKLALQKQKLETVVISSLDNSNKKDMPLPPWISKIGTKEVDVVMIDTNTYRVTYRLKGA